MRYAAPKRDTLGLYPLSRYRLASLFTRGLRRLVTSVFYISPSVIPSRSANSVHVVHQCAGFVKAGAQVTLVAKRSVKAPTDLPAALAESYGVPAGIFNLESFFSESPLGDNLRIAALALMRLAQRSRPNLVLSRNLYAAYVLGVLLRRPLVFETHQLEQGARQALQRAVMTQPTVTTVVISEKLREILSESHGVTPRRTLVLHDAAPEGICPVPIGAKRQILKTLLPNVDFAPWRAVCGYFGHFYPGRGIEIIETYF